MREASDLASIRSASSPRMARLRVRGAATARPERLNGSLTWAFVVERVKGIEPSLSAWEADVLPLNYTRQRPSLYPSRPTPCTHRESSPADQGQSLTR